MEHGFTWVSLISHEENIQLIITTLLVVALLILVSLRVRSSIAKSAGDLVPEEKFSFRNFFELVVQAALNLLKDIIGPHSEKYLPLIGALFVFILFSNLLGMIPGFLPPTSSLYTNGACGLIVFLYYNYQGFKEHGPGYIKQFLGPVWYLSWLMIIIELFSHVFRPFSLMVRLYGNISGDHQVLAIFSSLVPLVVPVIFLILGLIVAFVQAFVFATLSAVYIGLAVSHDH